MNVVSGNESFAEYTAYVKNNCPRTHTHRQTRGEKVEEKLFTIVRGHGSVYFTPPRKPNKQPKVLHFFFPPPQTETSNNSTTEKICSSVMWNSSEVKHAFTGTLRNARELEKRFIYRLGYQCSLDVESSSLVLIRICFQNIISTLNWITRSGRVCFGFPIKWGKCAAFDVKWHRIIDWFFFAWLTRTPHR